MRMLTGSLLVPLADKCGFQLERQQEVGRFHALSSGSFLLLLFCFVLVVMESDWIPTGRMRKEEKMRQEINWAEDVKGRSSQEERKTRTGRLQGPLLINLEYWN